MRRTGDPKDHSLEDTVLGPARVLKRGDVVADRYEVQDLLGIGGMGAVYRVLDRDLGEVVALKVLVFGTIEEEEALERFRREVRVARRVTHRNVCRTFDLGDDGGVHFLTMELVEGTSLMTVLQEKGRLEPARAIAIALDVCEGLTAAHEAGVVHRDLKPANVLIAADGRVVLTDFGVARPLVQDGSSSLRTVGSVGTPAYMAPEQVNAEAVDARTDVYAFGAMLFEMLTGALPFDAPSPMAAAVKRLLEPPPDPRTIAPIPDALADLVLRCLAREPGDRPASAVEVARALCTIDAATSPREELAAKPSPARPSLAPTSPGDRALAVLPFRYRGPGDYEYLGDGLTDGLVDVLSRTRGLRVLGSGATAKYKAERDPTEIGRSLRVNYLVDGTVQCSGSRVRIVARLVEVGSGVQVWTDRFEGAIEDVFALEDTMSQRIAEELRLELGTLAHRGNASADAIRFYYEGRRQIRRFRPFGPDGAVALIGRCLALAPDFKPALAAAALASARGWFIPGAEQGRNWRVMAEDAVRKALEVAPDLAESHLAAAMFDVQCGEYTSAVRSLTKALEIAPTCPEAQEYLGVLLCEAGRPEEGVRRLRLALELDPSLNVVFVGIARHHALVGDMDGYETILRDLRGRVPADYLPLVQLEVRVGTWLGDLDRVRRMLALVRDDPAPPVQYVGGIARYVLGELDGEDLEQALTKLFAVYDSPRFISLVRQTVVEAHCNRGRTDLALYHLVQAAESVLIDVEWIERCPSLSVLRDRPGFVEARRIVRDRAEALLGL